VGFGVIFQAVICPLLIVIYMFFVFSGLKTAYTSPGASSRQWVLRKPFRILLVVQGTTLFSKQNSKLIIF
jgi:hypothetical protein